MLEDRQEHCVYFKTLIVTIQYTVVDSRKFEGYCVEESNCTPAFLKVPFYLTLAYLKIVSVIFG